MVVQAEIDLHGHTIDEAHDALSDFIVEARQHGYRCVRAIHGKGLTSPNREPSSRGACANGSRTGTKCWLTARRRRTPEAAARC
jgi:DNA-nicking Smr family endonuclease